MNVLLVTLSVLFFNQVAMAQSRYSAETLLNEMATSGTDTKGTSTAFEQEEKSIVLTLKELAKDNLIDEETAVRIKLYLKSVPEQVRIHYGAAKPYIKQAREFAANHPLHPFADKADEYLEFVREFYSTEAEASNLWIYKTTLKDTFVDVLKAFPDLLRTGRESGYVTEAIQDPEMRDFEKVKLAAVGYGIDLLRAAAVVDIASGGRVTGAARNYLVKRYPILGTRLGGESIRHVSEAPVNGQSRLLATDDIGNVQAVYSIKPEATPARISELRDTFLKVRDLESKGNIQGMINLLRERGISNKMALEAVPYETGSGSISGKTQELEWLLSQFLRSAEKAQADIASRGALATWIQIARVHFFPVEEAQ